MSEKRWIVNEFDQNKVLSFSNELNISQTLSKLLLKRGFSTCDQAKSFLKKDLSFFHSPFLMKDTEKGARVLIDALTNNEKILIWGDYDVDGVTSVTVLLKYIKSIGGNVEYYIPKRDDDGYGLNDRVINNYIDNGTTLIITVDSGITATNEIENAKSRGTRVIVTDHHECRAIIPNADAVINPKQPTCNYPFKELAGVGVVFKFICAVEILLNGSTHQEAVSKIISSYSDFIAIGTIADVMPLTDENRIIVSRGLKAIENTKNVGLSALIEEAGIDFSSKKRKISSTTIGFVLAPRINAAGRMESSEIAVNLFMTESYEDAANLAAHLDEINKQRQLIESQILSSAIEKIDCQCNLKEDKVIILEDDNWHHGIIGIASSRITEKYNLPSVLISFKQENFDNSFEIGKGSARSVKGMNLVEALSDSADLLSKYGGHELAAGLSIKRENLPEFRRRINEFAQKSFENVNLNKTVDIDCELSAFDISLKLANEINCLEPFGLSNPVPVFCTKNMIVRSIISIGDAKHTKLILELENSTYTALLFGTPAKALQFCEGDCVDIAYNIDINNFKNQQNVQMIVRDIRLSNSEKIRFEQQSDLYDKIVNDDCFNIAESYIPKRTDFAQVYTVLRAILCSHKFDEIFIPYISKMVYKKYSVIMPLYKIFIILDVLHESNLIDLSHTSTPLFKIISIKENKSIKGKVVLENTPTIKKLFLKANKS